MGLVFSHTIVFSEWIPILPQQLLRLSSPLWPTETLPDPLTATLASAVHYLWFPLLPAV